MSETTHTQLRITRRAADRLRAGHLWVYSSDIESLKGDAEKPRPGSMVSLTDGRGAPLGTAIYSDSSQIAARLVSTTQDLSRADYLDEIRERLDAALALRKIVAPLGDGTNAQRLVFSEADNLPGIVLDRYNDLVILQLLTQGTAQDDVRGVIVDGLKDAFAGQPLTIWERPDPRIRQLEQLEAPADGPLFTTVEEDAAPATTNIELNGLHYSYSAAAGQKTGAFLDQRLNYAAAARWVKASGKTRRGLDVCTYHGGFALHLAEVCEHVTGVDQSRSALEVADWNLSLNPKLKMNVDWIEADAFALLRAFDEAHNKPADSAPALPMEVLTSFDAIVLDPPAFAKAKNAVEGALRGYKELNLRAMKLLTPGGTLVTCSCSHHVSMEDFTAVVASAAADAGRRVQLLEVRAAAPDHPEVMTMPETRYLKCLICRVD